MIEFAENYKPSEIYMLKERTFVGRLGPCRYCGKQVPEVKFSKEAHSLPELIGNKLLFSRDECNTCNEYFDKHLENHLANFLGISRTTTRVDGKKGTPKFKSRSGERVEMIGNSLVILEVEGSGLTELNDDSGVFTIKTETNPYIPEQVYKCFVKMAMSIMPESELKGYSQCIEWIRFNKKPAKFDPGALKIYKTFVPGHKPFPRIWLQLFKRTGDKKKYPHMICNIAFDNFVFNFTVPFGSKDKIVDWKKSKLLSFPFFEGMLPGQKGKAQTEVLDLTEKTSKRNKNNAYMQTFQEWTSPPLEEIPTEVLDRIKELGLEFSAKLPEDS
ncbi:HNH endonuclease [Pseudomonas sp. BNK-43-a]|uniref:HNH endonuclease n=1 Tax=unclassified Pseudomonas TaxID=196821 RepID=UPI0039BFB1A5